MDVTKSVLFLPWQAPVSHNEQPRWFGEIGRAGGGGRGRGLPHCQICINLSCLIKEARARSGGISRRNSLATLSNYLSNDYQSMVGVLE